MKGSQANDNSVFETNRNGCLGAPSRIVGKKRIRNFSFIILFSVVLTAFTQRVIFGNDDVPTTSLKFASSHVYQQQEESLSKSPYKRRVQLHATQTWKELSILEDQMGDQYVSWDWGVDNKGLTFKSLQRMITPILRNRGLILIGDSTTRHLFGFLYCLLEGSFRGGAMTQLSGTKKCSKVQSKLKMECHSAEQQCGQIAKFTRTEYNKHFHLEFRPGNHLRDLEEETFDILKNESLNPHIPRRVIYIGMPCLHSLWTPGSREVGLESGISDWPGMFAHFYSRVREAAESAKVFYGMSNSICNRKLGDKKMTIDAYLKETTIDTTKWSGRRIIDYYNYNLPQADRLPPNYNGTIPAYRSFRSNHSSEDFSLLHDSGSLECSKIGMAVLLSQQEVESDNSYVLDMRSATSRGCNLTIDGVHYRGAVMLEKAGLIVKGVRRAFGD